MFVSQYKHEKNLSGYLLASSKVWNLRYFISARGKKTKGQHFITVSAYNTFKGAALALLSDLKALPHLFSRPHQGTPVNGRVRYKRGEGM